MLRLGDTSQLYWVFALAIFLIACLLGIFLTQKRKLPKMVEFFLRSLPLITLLLIFARPVFERSSEHNELLLLLDISDSVDPNTAEELLSKVKQTAAAGFSVNVVPFAGSSGGTTKPLTQSTTFESIKRSYADLNIGQTNIEASLRALPGLETEVSSRKVLLISDGFETSGDALDYASLLTSLGYQLYPISPERQEDQVKHFRISQLHAPLVAPAQKSVDIRVSLLNTTHQPQSGLLEVLHDGKVLLQRHEGVGPGKETLVIVSSDPSKEGIKEVTARLTPDDKRERPSSETIFLSGESREKVLLVSGNSEDERLLIPVFEGQAFQLTHLNAGDPGVVGRIAALPDFKEYSAVIFNNIGIGQIPSSAVPQVEEYVASGGGFVMVGGNRSFGLGGYLNTSMQDVLPVTMLPPRSEQKRLNVAVSLVIDKSKSMAAENRLEYTKEAAREVIRILKDEDLIQVIGFDNAPFEVVKMGLLANIRSEAIDRVGRLFPLGGTSPFPALAEARRSLEGAKAGRKHLILLTDGKIPDASPGYYEMVKEMRFVGITVSTVMIGEEQDFGFLKNMAEFGGGAYYQTYDPSSLPRIFLQDVKVRSGEKTIQESQEFPVRLGPHPKRTSELDAYPPLKGFVENEAKKAAQLELVLLSEGKAFPLLASWQYKKGKSIAFTSDANGRWSSNWGGWARFSRFWADVIDAVRSQKNEVKQNIRFDLRQSVEHGSLMLDLSVFSEEANTGASGQITFPGGSQKPVSFKSLSRGHFLAEVPQVKVGKYELQMNCGNTPLTPVAFYLSGELFGERKGQGFNNSFLDQLAVKTSGKVNPTDAELKETGKKRSHARDMSPWFFILAAALICFEIIRREIGFRRFRRTRAPTGIASSFHSSQRQ